MTVAGYAAAVTGSEMTRTIVICPTLGRFGSATCWQVSTQPRTKSPVTLPRSACLPTTRRHPQAAKARSSAARQPHQLAKTVRVAVASSVGLSISTGTGRARLELTVLRDNTTTAAISASLMIKPPSAGMPPTPTSFVFYATANGAFVDLAADVVWLTNEGLPDGVVPSPPDSRDPSRRGIAGRRWW